MENARLRFRAVAQSQMQVEPTNWIERCITSTFVALAQRSTRERIQSRSRAERSL